MASPLFLTKSAAKFKRSSTDARRMGTASSPRPHRVCVALFELGLGTPIQFRVEEANCERVDGEAEGRVGLLPPPPPPPPPPVYKSCEDEVEEAAFMLRGGGGGADERVGGGGAARIFREYNTW